MKKQSLVEVAKEAAEEPAAPESCEIKELKDECCLTYHGAQIKTADELLKSANIDLAIWEVVEQTVNNWEVAGKRRMGQDSERRWKADQLWKTGLRQIKVKLRRLAPKPIQEAIRKLMESAPARVPRTKPKISSRDPHMAEISIYDHHWGKYAWGRITGTNWDVKIADTEFRSAIDEMLARTATHNIEHFLFPVGNDWFHVNDWLSQTANGTRVESTDDRFERVFSAGCEALEYAITRCIQIAPITIKFVPGNHDRHTSWFLVKYLKGIFRNEPLVTIDDAPNSRKYFAYGPSLIGMIHGEMVKHADLPTLMATEVPQLWAESTFRTWRMGHWHTRRETRHTAGDTVNGVELRICPSMCGTDLWHYDHGFIGNNRMAECHLWSKTRGPAGHLIVHAKEPSVALAN